MPAEELVRGGVSGAVGVLARAYADGMRGVVPTSKTLLSDRDDDRSCRPITRRVLVVPTSVNRYRYGPMNSDEFYYKSSMTENLPGANIIVHIGIATSGD